MTRTARVFVLLTAFAAAAMPAHAAERREETASRGDTAAAALLSYDVMLGGLSIGTAEVRLRLPEDTVAGGPYAVAAALRTDGLLHTFTGFEARGETAGRLDSGRVLPERHESRTLWQEEPRRVGLRWTKPAAPPAAEVVPPPEADEREPIPPAETARAVDPLSGVLHLVARAAGAGGVSESVTVFDGRRLYTLALAAAEPATVDGPGWTGPGWKSALRYERLGGASKRHDGRQEIDGTVLMAPGEPFALPVAVPLRIVVPTQGFGSLVVELTAAQPGDA